MSELEWDGKNTIAVSEVPIELPKPNETGWRTFFQICCECASVHEVWIKDDLIQFKNVGDKQTGIIKNAISKEIATLKQQLAEKEARLAKLEEAAIRARFLITRIQDGYYEFLCDNGEFKNWKTIGSDEFKWLNEALQSSGGEAGK